MTIITMNVRNSLMRNVKECWKNRISEKIKNVREQNKRGKGKVQPRKESNKNVIREKKMICHENSLRR